MNNVDKKILTLEDFCSTHPDSLYRNNKNITSNIMRNQSVYVHNSNTAPAVSAADIKILRSVNKGTPALVAECYNEIQKISKIHTTKDLTFTKNEHMSFDHLSKSVWGSNLPNKIVEKFRQDKELSIYMESLKDFNVVISDLSRFNLYISAFTREAWYIFIPSSLIECNYENR